MNSRRTTDRRRSYLGARAVYDQVLSIDCVVRDLTDGGARLVFTAPPPAVKSFEVFLPTKGVRRPVTLAWHSGCEVGVTFAPQPLEHSEADRLRALERSNALLRNEIERLNISM